MADFHLQIISPDRIEFEGQVNSLVVPGGEGYLGVLANHAPLLSTLTDGQLTVRESSGTEQVYPVSGGGFLEVHSNKVVVLARHVGKPSQGE